MDALTIQDPRFDPEWQREAKYAQCRARECGMAYRVASAIARARHLIAEVSPLEVERKFREPQNDDV